ncbi:hypothetical protein [Sporomusa carbonis]|uniref:hypothetical protein n=1 Tax=Sporomusa carbonis TaxID=3076075 RepID=UPI003C79BAF1
MIKEECVRFHTIFSFVVLLVVMVHLYYNFAAIKQYLKVKREGVHILQSESLAAIIVILLICIGTSYNTPPLAQVMKLGESMKAS